MVSFFDVTNRSIIVPIKKCVIKSRCLQFSNKNLWMNEFKKLAMFQIRITKPHQLAVMITTNQDWHDKTYYDVGISTSTPAASTPVFYMVNSLKYLPDCLYFQTTRTHRKRSLLQGLLFQVQDHAEPFQPVWPIIHRKCLHQLLFSSLLALHLLHIR